MGNRASLSTAFELHIKVSNLQLILNALLLLGLSDNFTGTTSASSCLELWVVGTFRSLAIMLSLDVGVESWVGEIAFSAATSEISTLIIILWSTFVLSFLSALIQRASVIHGFGQLVELSILIIMNEIFLVILVASASRLRWGLRGLIKRLRVIVLPWVTVSRHFLLKIIN